MASTGFWPVKGRLKDVIEYARNPEKTVLIDDMKQSLGYIADADKTEQMMFVSAINCPKQRAYERMMETKRRFGKMGGNVAYHGFQSFVSGELTPEEAHEIGMETARRMWGDAYEVVVATHLNTDNLHNHFIVNSVSFKTGKKYGNHISDHMRLRDVSDGICRERGKSVQENSSFFGGSKGEYWPHKAGKLTHRDMLRRDVDTALSFVRSFAELEIALQRMGYEVIRSGEDYKHISVKAPDWQRAARIDKLGTKYTYEAMEERFEQNRYGGVDIPMYLIKQTQRFPVEYTFIFRLRREIDERSVLTQDLADIYYDLFIALLKLVKEAAKTIWQPLSPELRYEVRNIEEYIAERRFIADYGLLSEAAVGDFIVQTKNEISELESQRYEVDKRIRRAKTPEDKEQLKAQRREISAQIKPLRLKLKEAERIAEHIPKIKDLLEKEWQREIETYTKPKQKDKERYKY